MRSLAKPDAVSRPQRRRRTVYELGYNAGRRKLLFAYSNDPAAQSGARRANHKLTKSSAVN